MSILMPVKAVFLITENGFSLKRNAFHVAAKEIDNI